MKHLKLVVTERHIQMNVSTRELSSTGNILFLKLMVITIVHPITPHVFTVHLKYCIVNVKERKEMVQDVMWDWYLMSNIFYNSQP